MSSDSVQVFRSQMPEAVLNPADMHNIIIRHVAGNEYN